MTSREARLEQTDRWTTSRHNTPRFEMSMSWKNVRLIFLREVRDQLRDRRTLFMVAILPMLLYPALGLGMLNMTATLYRQIGNVVFLGANELEGGPEPLPALYQADRFLPSLFLDPTDAEKLHIISDSPSAAADLTEADATKLRAAQAQIDTIDDLAAVVRERQELEARINEIALSGISPTATPADVGTEMDDEDATVQTTVVPELSELRQQIADLLAEEERIKAGLTGWFEDSDIQVLVVVPEGFAESVHQVTQSLIEREQASRDIPHPVVLHNSANEQSQIAHRRVREAIDNWEHLVLQGQLSAAGLPASIDKPVDPTRVDLAQNEQIAANFWSKLFPTLLVIMALTGAFYPAIDLGAGEKERGTMETLLICPATRTEIVLGKFFTVMLFSFSTALLNIACMGVTGTYIMSLSAGAGAAGGLLGGESIPPIGSMIWLLVLAVPMSALFSSLSLAFAMFARSSKEGQYYLTPLLVVTMGLTFYCLYPGVEIDPFKSILPVIGPALLLKSLLQATGNLPEILAYAVPVLVSSLAYCALALWWAIDIFSKESVLFREAERFEFKLWVAHVFRDKEPTPSFTEAAFCIVLILLLQFATLSIMQDAFADALGSTHASIELLRLQTISLIATIGTPAVMMGLLLTSRVSWTLKLHWPPWPYLVLAAILPLILQPVSMHLLHSLEWFFPPMPEGAEALLDAVEDRDISIWLPLLAFAVTPAVCEELAFRGFILTGLQRSGRNWLAIVISAIVFGLIHMIPQQQFNAALLGIVLGLLAVRSGSLLPPIIFHFVNNGLQVVQARLQESTMTEGAMANLFYSDGSTLLARWPVLIICIAASATLIFWLVKQPSAPARPAE